MRLDPFLVATVLLGVVGCRGLATEPVIRPIAPCPAPAIDTTGWHQVTNEAFSFRVPPRFQLTPSRGFDSFTRQYSADSGATHVGFDFGWHSGTVEQYANFPYFQTCTEQISDRAATVMTAIILNPHAPEQDGNHVAVATWRNLYAQPDTAFGITHLSFWAETRDPAHLAELLMVLRTVRITSR